MKRSILFIILFFVISSSVYANYDRYFTVTGAGSQNGLSWANAWPGSSLQEKIYSDVSLSGSAGNTCIVNIASGAYNAVAEDGINDWKGAFSLQAYQILRGSSDPLNPTILNGVSGNHAAVHLKSFWCGLEYITVTGGGNTGNPIIWGGGINIDPTGTGSSVITNYINNCIVSGNVSAVAGAGIYANQAKVLNSLITHNTLTTPTTTYGGAGIYMSTRSMVSNCIIEKNVFVTGQSGNGGAGVSGMTSYNTLGVYDSIIRFNTNMNTYAGSRNGGGASYAKLIRCIIQSNKTTYVNSGTYGGGSAYSYQAGCIFDGNSSAGAYGAIYNSQGTVNCTIITNLDITNPYSVACHGASSTIFANNIIYNNNSNALTISVVDPSYTNGNYFGNPKFIITNVIVNPTYFDNYKIQYSSPCYNRGDNSYVAGSPGDTIQGMNTKDILLRDRINNSIVDSGAIEWLNDGGSRKRAILMFFEEYKVKE